MKPHGKPVPSKRKPKNKDVLNVSGRVRAGGDVVGRDKITHIHRHAGPPPLSDEDYYAARTKYLKQVIERTELLELVGIPEHGKPQAEIKLEDIFIPLGAEEELDPTASTDALAALKVYAPDALLGQDKLELARERTPERASRKVTRRVTLDDAFKHHTQLMIVGDPGAGKSTLLRFLTLAAARALASESDPIPNEQDARTGEASAIIPVPAREQRLPIFIPLRRFAASEADSLVEFFHEHVKHNYQLELPRAFFERALEAGECLLCFDGLDEVVLSDQRVAVRDAVAALASRYPRNRYVVTSRIVGYEQAPLDRRAFAHHTVLPFQADEIQTFVHKWYHAREPVPAHAEAQAKALVKTIQDNDRLLKLAENPLMLTIIALVHRIEAELPNERVKLYDKCTEALLGTWESVKGFALSEHERERPYYKFRRRLLEKLAFWMHTLPQQQGRQAEVKSGELELKLVELLREEERVKLSADEARLEAKAFLDMAKRRTGILVERGDGVYSFLHLTFQEYFCACDIESRYIYDLEQLWRVIQPHLYDPRWHEVILLLLGKLNRYDMPPTILVEKILNEGDAFDEVVHRNLLLAARCLADKVNVQEELHHRIVNTLAQLARKTKSEYWTIGDHALEALATLSNDPAAGNALLTIVRTYWMDAYVRKGAAQSLGQMGSTDETVVDGLCAFAQAPQEDIEVQIAAAQALGQLGHAADAARILLRMARNPELSTDTQRGALRELGKLGYGDRDITQGLLELAQTTKMDLMARGGAIQALGQLGMSDNVVIDSLLALARDPDTDPYVRRDSTLALAQLGYADEAALVLVALAQDLNLDEHERSDAIQALAQTHGADFVLDSLLALAQDPNIAIFLRLSATRSLAELGYIKDATAILLVLAQDRTLASYIRNGAVETLGALGNPDEAVIKSLDILAQDLSTDTLIRCSAAEALGQLGSFDEAVRTLTTLTQDLNTNASFRRSAAQTLGKLGYVDDASRLLLAIAQDKNQQTYDRRSATLSLGQLARDNKVVIDGLLALVQDAALDANLQDAAVKSLGQLGTNEPRVVLPLLALSKSKSPETRSEAYLALKEAVGNLRHAEVAKQSGKPEIKRKSKPKPKASTKKPTPRKRARTARK